MILRGGGGKKPNFAGSDTRQITLGIRQIIIIPQTQNILQNAGPRIAIGILPGTVLVSTHRISTRNRPSFDMP